MPTNLTIQKISITDLAVDAIVNAANSRLQHGGGVCGAIFSAAGPRELQAACDEIGHCETGSAVTTPGFRLKAGYVIHAVGPVWYGGNNGEAEKLYSCYQAAMEEARKHDCRSIAFPLISSGIYGYPREDAWAVAIRSIRDWQKNHGDYPLNVVIAVIDDRAMRLGNSVMAELLPSADNRCEVGQL